MKMYKIKEKDEDFQIYVTYSTDFKGDLEANCSREWICEEEEIRDIYIMGRLLYGINNFDEAIYALNNDYDHYLRDAYEMVSYPATEITSRRITEYMEMDNGLIIFRVKDF